MKNVVFSILMLFLVQLSFGQQDNYKWRLGVHGGFNSYYGDLSTSRLIDPHQGLIDLDTDVLSYGFSAERSISKAWGLRLLFTKGQFTANDRTIKWNGDLYTDNDNFSRSLNAQTSFWDASLMFNYYFDNGKIFGTRSFFAPYVGLGIGINQFDVKGDLLAADGSRYHYWSDQTIRNMSELDPNAATAQIITQDGVFETDLDNLNTEGKDYDTRIMTIPIALGMKFRLGERFNLNLETMLSYTNSDYLDDVHETYYTEHTDPFVAYAANPANISGQVDRGNNDNKKDIYGFFSASLHYNFGYKKDAFLAPIFYTGWKEQDVVELEQEEETIMITSDTLIVLKAAAAEVDFEKTPHAELGDNDMIETELELEQVEKSSKINEENPIEIADNDIVDQVIEESLIIEIEEEVESPLVDESIEPIEETRIDSFTIEKIEMIKTSPLVSKEEKVLMDIQYSNLELVRLHNRINDLQLKDEQNEEEMDGLYEELDELQNKFDDYQKYNADIATSSDEAYRRSENEAIRKSTAEMEAEMRAMRIALQNLQLQPNSNKSTDASLEMYKQLRTENNKKIEQLEKELAKAERKAERAEKQVQKIKNEANVIPYTKNKSRMDLEEKPATTEPKQPKVQYTERYDTAMVELISEIETLKKSTATAADIKVLENRLTAIEANLSKATVPNKVDTNKVVIEDNQSKKHIESLEEKLEQLSAELSATKLALAQKTETPVPTVIVTKPIEQTRSALVDTKKLAKNAIMELGPTNIFFGVGKSAVTSTSHAALNRVVDLANQYPEIKIQLIGYTDKSGSPDANFRLSQKRASSVRMYLNTRGIDSTRISEQFFGETQAAAENDPFARRVELKLLVY